MPLYDYQCQNCAATFTHFWRSLAAATQNPAPGCPECQSLDTQRIVSQVAVLGGLGGLTPGESTAENKQAERLASITPRDQIDRLQKGKKVKKAGR